MKTAIRVLLLLLPALPAFADEASPTLDLSLPKASIYANDPPGTWYGDRSSPDAVAYGSRCPSSPDGTPSDLTGSVTMGHMWSSRGGGGSYNAVALNYCRDTYDDEGNSRLFNVSLHVNQSDVSAPRRTANAGPYAPPRGAHPPRGR